MRWHATGRGFRAIRRAIRREAGRLSAPTAFSPIDHKVRTGSLGGLGRGIRIRLCSIGAIGGIRIARRRDDRRDHGRRRRGRRGHFFHCGTVEQRRQQETAADHQPADDDTSFHNAPSLTGGDNALLSPLVRAQSRGGSSGCDVSFRAAAPFRGPGLREPTMCRPSTLPGADIGRRRAGQASDS